MKTKINNKEVEIENKQRFTYDGVGSEKLKELNETLYDEISRQVAYYIDNKERLDKEAAEKFKQEAITLQTEQAVAFKKEVEQCHGVKDYALKFQEPNGDRNTEMRSVEVSNGAISNNIEFDDKVYSGSGWGSHKTSSPWVLSINYNKRRYSTLNNVLKKCIKNIEEQTVERNQKQTQEAAMRKFADDNDFEFAKNYHSSRSRYSNSYYTYSMSKGNIIARIFYSEEKKKVVITSYSVVKENITMEELESIL